MEDPDAKKDYPPYIINRCLSGHLDCVMFANEMNKYSFLDKDMQYSFYLQDENGNTYEFKMDLIYQYIEKLQDYEY